MVAPRSAARVRAGRLVDVCYRKCVVKVKEEDLAVGEMTCCDRCVAKYLVRSRGVADAAGVGQRSGWLRAGRGILCA
jgi:Tim10/DDP family zinc finger